MSLKVNQLDGFGSAGPLYSDQCTDITPWTDGDAGVNAASTQVTFDGESTFKFDSGDAGATATRSRNDAAIIPTQSTITMRLQPDLLGTLANGDYIRFNVENDASDSFLQATFASDGLFILDSGASNVEVGTNIVTLDQWDVWQFVINFPAAEVDVLLNGAIQGTGFDMFGPAAVPNRLFFSQQGTTTPNQITYVDWITVE